jgi:TolB-like 6-blade propeller-like
MIRTYYLINFYIAILFLASCSSDNSTTFNKFPSTKIITGKRIEIDQNILLRSNRIFLADSILIVLEGKNEKYLYLFNVNNTKLIGTGGIKGQGPGELISPWLLIESNKKNSFCVYDMTTKRLNYFNIDSIRNNLNYRPNEYINFSPESGSCNFPAWISDSVLVSPGIFSSGRLAFIDLNGKLLKRSGKVPDKKSHKGVSNEFVLQAYQSVLTINPNTKDIAVCSRYADRIELYDSIGTERRIITGPQGFIPKYRIGKAMGSAVLIQDKKIRFGYIDVVSDEKYIYALFSGRTRLELQGKANYGNFIFKFDWDGNPITMFELDSLLLSITIDKKNKIIYGITNDKNVKIISYKL